MGYRKQPHRGTAVFRTQTDSIIWADLSSANGTAEYVVVKRHITPAWVVAQPFGDLACAVLRSKKWSATRIELWIDPEARQTVLQLVIAAPDPPRAANNELAIRYMLEKSP